MFELIRVLLLLFTVSYFATAGLALGYSVFRLLADGGERVAINSSFNWKLTYFQLLLIPIGSILYFVYPDIGNWFFSNHYWLIIPFIIGAIIRLIIAVSNVRKKYRKPSYKKSDLLYDVIGFISCLILGLLVASIVHPQVGPAKAGFVAKHLQPLLNYGHISAMLFVPAFLAYYATSNVLMNLKNKFIAAEFKEMITIAGVVAYAIFAFSFVLSYALDNFFVRQITLNPISFLCFFLATLSIAVSAISIKADKFRLTAGLSAFQIIMVSLGFSLAMLPTIVKRIDQVFNFYVTCLPEQALNILALSLLLGSLLIMLMAYFLNKIIYKKRNRY